MIQTHATSSAHPLRVAYFGLPLGALLLAGDGHQLTLAVVSPVPAPGLRRLLRAYPAVLQASVLGTALGGVVSQALEANPPDLLVSWFWTRRLPVSWLNSARLDAVGVHPSLLPRHRGPNPYFWTIDAGDRVTGVSVHRLEAEYDRGAILAQEQLAVGARNAWQLARALDRPSLRSLRRVVAAYARGEAPEPVSQDHALATPAPEPSGDALRVDFRWPSDRVLRRIRALSPVPGLALSLAERDFFVIAAEPAARYNAALLPGEAQIEARRLVLRTGDTAISVERALWPNESDTDEDEPAAIRGAELADLLGERLRSRSGRG